MGDDRTVPENTLSYGEKAVGRNFDLGGNKQVEEVKHLYAQIIDILNAEREISSISKGTLFTTAITEAQGAQMWGVKAITWKD